MPRPRHAMRVHPLRTKGVVVGIPVAAAVAFGAHSVLGVTPLSDQQDTSSSASTTPQAAAPVQSYGLAQAPPPTTLGLLSAPTDAPAAAPTAPASTGTAGSSSGSTAASPAPRTTTEPIAGPSHTVPIAPAAAPKPSMMTFSGAPQQAAAAPARQAAAPAVTDHDDEDAPHEQAPQQQGGGGSLLGVDLGVAKVSVLSFG